MERCGLLIFFASLLVLSGFTAAQPESTVCTSNPGAEACQEPVFADDQDEYFFDLRASSVLNDGALSTDSVTMLHGGLAGSLETNSSDIQSVPGK